MLVSSLYESKFLKASDLRGKLHTVRIEKTSLQEFQGKVSIILSFVDKKKTLRLNKVNAMALSKVLGDDTDKWRGATIELTPSQTTFKGDLVDAIRIGKVDGTTVELGSTDEPDDDGDIPF